LARDRHWESDLSARLSSVQQHAYSELVRANRTAFDWLRYGVL
jgi:hypothetical protein